MTLSADNRDTLRLLGELGIRPMHLLSPEAARAQLAQSRPDTPSLAAMHDIRVFMVEVGDGMAIRAKVLTPSPSPAALIVYFHGGGWMVGTIEDYEPLGRMIAVGTGCAVVLVEYRLAPENPFPAAVNDAERVVRWASGVMEPLLGRQMPLVVAGDSAGGNLAAVVAQRCRAVGSPDIALQVLAYPVTDCGTETASYVDPDNQLLLGRDTMRWFWEHYVPDAASRTRPDASPLRAADLSGLPAAVVLTAEHDVLRDEGEAYAMRMQAAGVPVVLRRFDGEMHGFLSRFAMRPSARAPLAWLVDTVRESLSRMSDRTDQFREVNT